MELARRFNTPAVAVQFDVQAEDCIARCCNRKKHEGGSTGGIHAGNAQSAVTAMAQRLVPPSVNEGFQKVFVMNGDRRQSQSLLNNLFAVHDHKEQLRGATGAAAVNSSDGVLPNSRMMSPLNKGATEPESFIGPVLYLHHQNKVFHCLAVVGKAVMTPPAAAANELITSLRSLLIDSLLYKNLNYSIIRSVDEFACLTAGQSVTCLPMCVSTCLSASICVSMSVCLS